MNFVGIDIGSTASKVAVRGKQNFEFILPTGWNSKETALGIAEKLLNDYHIDVESKDTIVVSTGYGRISVPYASREVTEITCHGMGIREFMDSDLCTIIDVGGQDTKIISLKDGYIDDFIMNDKCSAGTGRFLEIMANRLSISLDELFSMARKGKLIKISSMCTVFAESEIISLIGRGEKKEDIAAGVVDSVVVRVAQLANRQGLTGDIVLTGGLSINKDFVNILSNELGKEVLAWEKARYAGAIGAALIGKNKRG